MMLDRKTTALRRQQKLIYFLIGFGYAAGIAWVGFMGYVAVHFAFKFW